MSPKKGTGEEGDYWGLVKPKLGSLTASAVGGPREPRVAGRGIAREQVTEAEREDRGSARSGEGAFRNPPDRVAAILKERLGHLSQTVCA